MIKAVILLIILAFVLRILFIFQGSLSFHYDMARDGYIARQIWQDHHLKILGPPTSTPGLYHGVLYYYLIAPFYGISHGDPTFVALFLSLLNSLTIIPIFLLAKDLFKSNKWAILSGLLFALSFEATQYGPWLSNPAPAVFTTAWFFYGLRLWQKGNVKGLYWAAFFAALSTQFQFFLIYLFILIPIFKYLFKIKVKSKEIGLSVIIAFLTLINFVIAAIKFNTLATLINGFLGISVSTQVDFRVKFSDLALNYINRLADLFINNFFPVNVFLGGLLGLIVIFYIRKEKFLLFGLLSNLLIFIFGGHSNAYVNIGLLAPVILAVTLSLKKIQSQNKKIFITIIVLIITANLYSTYKNSPQGQVTLVIPKDMILKNQLRLIDDSYRLANFKPFSINTLTLPLWTNTTWAYLYSWYGKNKYGYVPSFYGHNQIGLLGVDSLPLVDKPFDNTFFILEPTVAIPADIYNLEIGSENSKTDLIKEFLYGELRLQYRKPKVV